MNFLKGQIISSTLFAVHDVYLRHRGITGLHPSANVRYSREFAPWAEAVASVRDTPRMAFAPRLVLLSFLSHLMSSLSIFPGPLSLVP